MPELPKEEPKEVKVTSKKDKTEYQSEEFIKYSDVKWRVVNKIVEKAYYCPHHEAKLLPSKGKFGAIRYSCPMDNCNFETYLHIEETYEKALAAIPAIIKQDVLNKLTDTFGVLGTNKYVEHAGVLWEYNSISSKLNEEALCPADKTPLLIDKDILKGASPMQTLITEVAKASYYLKSYYCPKCGVKYLQNVSDFDIAKIKLEVKTIIKGKMKS